MARWSILMAAGLAAGWCARRRVARDVPRRTARRRGDGPRQLDQRPSLRRPDRIGRRRLGLPHRNSMPAGTADAPGHPHVRPPLGGVGVAGGRGGRGGPPPPDRSSSSTACRSNPDAWTASRSRPWRRKATAISITRASGSASTARPTSGRRGGSSSRVEQIFAAYRQALAPRNRPTRPPRLVVFRSMEQYLAFLSSRGVKIRNRACFLEDENVVAVGSDLARLSARMEKINRQSDEILAQLEELKKQLRARLAKIADNAPKESRAAAVADGTTPFRRRLQGEKEGIGSLRAAGGPGLSSRRRPTVRANLPRDVPRLPGELRLSPRDVQNAAMAQRGAGRHVRGRRFGRGHAAGGRPQRRGLEAIEGRSVRLTTAWPWKNCWRPTAQDFLQLHDADAAASDRLYAYAWGLAYYLAFEKRLLSDPALAEYVCAGGRAARARAAFRAIGQDAAGRIRAAVAGVCAARCTEKAECNCSVEDRCEPGVRPVIAFQGVNRRLLSSRWIARAEPACPVWPRLARSIDRPPLGRADAPPCSPTISAS